MGCPCAEAGNGHRSSAKSLQGVAVSSKHQRQQITKHHRYAVAEMQTDRKLAILGQLLEDTNRRVHFYLCCCPASSLVLDSCITCSKSVKHLAL